MDSSKQYRRMSVTGLNEQYFIPEKTSDQEIAPVILKLTGETAPPPSLEDVAYLHHCFQPLWVFMRVLGAFPITFTDTGIAVFKVKSRAFAYTSFVLLMTTILCILSVTHRFDVLRSAEFHSLIFSYKSLLYCVTFWFFPIGHFLGPARIACYINELAQFLTRVHQMTGTPLPINFHRNILVLTVILPLMVSSLVVYEYNTLDNYLVYEAVFFGCTLTLINYHMLIWCSICAILKKASTQLGDLLTEELRAHGRDLDVVPKYRALWDELSYMTRATGDVMSYAYGWLLLSMFTVLTCTTYGFLAESNFEKFGVKELRVTFNALVVYIILYVFTTSSHSANISVDHNFLRRLKELKSPSKDVQQQLEFFQIATRLDSPCISLGGYVIINRGLLITVLAAIVTYLVVLLQFKVGTEPVLGDSSSNNASLT